MKVNINPKIRQALYVLTAIGTPLVAYLLAVGVLDENAVALWSAEVTVVSVIAGFNVNKE